MEMASATSFIKAMSSAVTGVSIVSTDGPGGKFGVTVSAVSSISAEPPLVMACINRKSPALEAIATNGHFCVNLLNAQQTHLSDNFSGRPGALNPYEFNPVFWDETGAAPVLKDASANFVCSLSNSYDAGTHRLILGLVQKATHTDNMPLAYAQRAYHEPKLINSSNS
ncbi:MAG: flavin reductase family protein [Pseudomonadota bacterium]